MTLGYLPGFSDPATYMARLFATSGKLAFDVGANAGWVSEKLAQRFDQVVAFEPAKESYDVLCLMAERCPNLTPVGAAVSRKSGHVILRETPITEKWGELVTGDSMPDWGPTTGWRDVPAVTLDDCLLVYGAPDLVKIDTEGHEVDVLEGAVETIDVARPQWWIEVHDQDHDPLIRELLDGYQIEVIRHDGYVSGGTDWARHYYLVATP